jgi:hypothetical protein
VFQEKTMTKLLQKGQKGNDSKVAQTLILPTTHPLMSGGKNAQHRMRFRKKCAGGHHERPKWRRFKGGPDVSLSMNGSVDERKQNPMRSTTGSFQKRTHSGASQKAKGHRKMYKEMRRRLVEVSAS